MWQITFDQSGTERYDVNEAARLITNIGSADSRTEFTVTGDTLDFDQYMHDILMEIANSPATKPLRILFFFQLSESTSNAIGIIKKGTSGTKNRGPQQ